MPAGQHVVKQRQIRGRCSSTSKVHLRQHTHMAEAAQI
jgi:hypothetical protein